MAAVSEIRKALSTVVDPEIPVLTIEDMGILRDVKVDGGRVVVTITPTYSGCPAMGVITNEIESAVSEAGYEVEVRLELSPAWTTDWMTEEAHRKLTEFGIAAPTGSVQCPRCASSDITTISQFGSTACKALMVCDTCREPFDQFKQF